MHNTLVYKTRTTCTTCWRQIGIWQYDPNYQNRLKCLQLSLFQIARPRRFLPDFKLEKRVVIKRRVKIPPLADVMQNQLQNVSAIVDARMGSAFKFAKIALS